MMRQTIFRRATVTAACALALLAAPSALPAQEAGTLAKAMQDLAADIGKELIRSAESDIRMGSFDGPGSGQIMKKLLKEELEKIVAGQDSQGKDVPIKVHPEAAWMVSADYSLDDSDPEQLTAMIEAKLKDRRGRAAGKHTFFVSNKEDLIRVFNPTQVELPVSSIAADNPAKADPLAESKAQAKALGEAIVEPKFDNANLGTAISPSTTSPYHVEVLVEQSPGSYVAVPLTDNGGKAGVRLDKDQNYALRIVNDSGEPVGVEVLIDGINIFAFSEIPSYRKFGKICLTGRDAVIHGWHFRNGPLGSKKFRITEWAQSAQALLGSRDESQLGAITVIFSACWLEGQTPPPDAGLKTSDLGTAPGEEVDNRFRDVRCFFGRPRSSVSVRYLRPVIELTPDDRLPAE